MAVFKYKTYDSSGKTSTGIIDADGADQAISKLKTRGLFPFEVTRETDNHVEKTGRSLDKKRIAKSDITDFTRQLATLTASGMPLVDALTALSEQTANRTLRKTIVDIKEKVSAGSAFFEALSDFPRYFSSTYRSLVKAGETGGELDAILEELADLGEKQELIKSKVMAALTYPIFMTIVGIAVLALLFTLVIPRIISIFSNMGQSLPLPTKLLIYTTTFLQSYWPFLLLFFIVTAFILHKIKSTQKGKIHIDRLLLKLPVMGQIFCQMEIARFARTFALLLKGGVPATQALSIAKETVKNQVLSGSIEKARETLTEGGSISESLKEDGLFPPVAVHMIATGEKGGNLEKMLTSVAGSFERQIETFTSSLASIVEPILIILMGLIVGFIALAILLPIFEMNMMVR